MVGCAEGSSEARGPSGRPTCAALAVATVEADKKRRRRRKERQKPREKKIVLPPPPPTAGGRAMQLLDTMAQRGVGRGGAAVHVIEKALTQSDVDIEQCRLQLTRALVDRLLDPQSQILTVAETAELRAGTQGLDVAAVDRANNKYDMMLKFSGSVKQYRIMKWAQFCVDHDLRAGQTIAIWVYRQPPEKTDKSGKLGLVLLYYDEDDEQQKEMDAQLLDSRIVDSMNALLMLEHENAAVAPAGGGS